MILSVSASNGSSSRFWHAVQAFVGAFETFTQLADIGLPAQVRRVLPEPFDVGSPWNKLNNLRDVYSFARWWTYLLPSFRSPRPEDTGPSCR